MTLNFIHPYRKLTWTTDENLRDLQGRGPGGWKALGSCVCRRAETGSVLGEMPAHSRTAVPIIKGSLQVLLWGCTLRLP